jgi:uncharacterized protein YuzE
MTSMANVRVTLDKSADAAYIYLVGDIARGGVAETVPIGPDDDIALDFGADGVLLGIEVLDATRLLPEEVLAQAELIG